MKSLWRNPFAGGKGLTGSFALSVCLTFLNATNVLYCYELESIESNIFEYMYRPGHLRSLHAPAFSSNTV